MSKCNRCKYEHDSAIDEPCVSCSKSTSHFEPKEKEHSSNCTIQDIKFKNKDYGFDEIDMVNHPQHYSAHGIEPIDYIESYNLNFNLGNVIKYVSRAPYKEAKLEDLKKAKWYLEREIKKYDR